MCYPTLSEVNTKYQDKTLVITKSLSFGDIRSCLKGTQVQKSFRKNYATTTLPDGSFLTCSSIPLGNDSIHAEVWLLILYLTMFDELPPYILNWRTWANGTIVGGAEPCHDCSQFCKNLGMRTIEVLEVGKSGRFYCSECDLEDFIGRESLESRRKRWGCCQQ
jgi:hypothetical protein